MRETGLLVIVFVKAAILALYASLQDTLMKDIPSEYRFLIYLVVWGAFLLALGLTWRSANIIQLHWWGQCLLIPAIIIMPIALASLYFSNGSVDKFTRPFQDVDGLLTFAGPELVVTVIVFTLLKWAWRGRIQRP